MANRTGCQIRNSKIATHNYFDWRRVAPSLPQTPYGWQLSSHEWCEDQQLGIPFVRRLKLIQIIYLMGSEGSSTFSKIRSHAFLSNCIDSESFQLVFLARKTHNSEGGRKQLRSTYNNRKSGTMRRAVQVAPASQLHYCSYKIRQSKIKRYRKYTLSNVARISQS